MSKIEQIPWDHVEDSSNVHSLYRHDDGTICVRFNGGGLYTYIGAPEQVYMDLRFAESVGKYLNRVVKAYPYTRWDTENELLDHLNITGQQLVTCVRCNTKFTTTVKGCVVCDSCWADDPT